jgi:hypothetical protein
MRWSRCSAAGIEPVRYGGAPRDEVSDATRAKSHPSTSTPSPPADSMSPSHDVPDLCIPVTRMGRSACRCRLTELNGCPHRCAHAGLDASAGRQASSKRNGALSPRAPRWRAGRVWSHSTSAARLSGWLGDHARSVSPGSACRRGSTAEGSRLPTRELQATLF